jgi:hypothetical protein
MFNLDAAIDACVLKNVSMKQTGKMQPKNCWQFFQSLVSSIQSRSMTTTSAHSSATGEIMQQACLHRVYAAIH